MVHFTFISGLMAVLGAIFIGVGVHILLYFKDAVDAVIKAVSFLSTSPIKQLKNN